MKKGYWIVLTNCISVHFLHTDTSLGIIHNSDGLAMLGKWKVNWFGKDIWSWGGPPS